MGVILYFLLSILVFFILPSMRLPISSLISISRTSDHPSTVIVLSLLKNIVIWRRDERNNNVKFHWSETHLSTVHDYLYNLYHSCDFTDLRFSRLLYVIFVYDGLGKSWRVRAKIAAYFTQELHQFFRVPTLKKHVEKEHDIEKHQLVQVFLSFLVELLSHSKTKESDVQNKNQIENLEKELRFLLTVVGDKSLTLCGDEHLMGKFETVANEAGSVIHSILFSSTDRSYVKMGMDVAVVLYQLQDNIERFSSLLTSVTEPAYRTPETSMVDSLILHSLIHDLEDLISREDRRVADVKGQLKILHQGFTFLQSSIKDVGLQRPSEIGELKEPLKRIGNLVHQTEYLIVSFLSGDAPLWYLIDKLAYINQKMEVIATELREITRKSRPGALKSHIPLQGEGNTEMADVIVDFNDRRTTDVLDFLVGRGKSLQVISISGMPGLGKTTLAKKLYDHPLINSWFDIKSWRVVSQNYARHSILADILIQINGGVGKDSTDSESLVVQIHKTLFRRRYLIVIDDVWGLNVWDDLMRCFPDDENGSRVLFTTRNKDVGPSNCNDYAVPSLSNEECWELLEKKVFGNSTCPQNLIRTGKKIAANCWGLPIAVVVIAGILSTMDKEKFLWKEVKRNLSLYICEGGNNSVMQILKLSYRHLPDRLKPCFLYFRAFTEQRKVRVGELMRLWIAEGFIHKEEGKRAEDVAEEYLMELIDKSLVMVAERGSYGGVKTCVLHDLLHDFCYKICDEENFLTIEKSSICSVFEHGIYGLKSEYYIAWNYCAQVRSLPEAYQSPFYLNRMRLLRVLHSHIISHHLSGVEYLVNLRYLVIRYLPSSIGSLVNLEFLRVEIHDVVYLPPVILRMVKLRYLNVDQARFGVYYERVRTNNLEFLSNISIVKLEDEEMLKSTPNLRKLKCEYRCEPPSYNFDLRFLTHLESLKIQLHWSRLMQINFPLNLKKLSMYGWDDMPLEMMSVIGRLEKLEVLKLGCLTGFEGERWDTREGEFQKLKFLKLDQLQDLTEWNVESSSHFPALRRLVLVDCLNLLEIPGEIGEIATLQLIEIKGRCTESLVESAKEVQQQQLDFGNEEFRVPITNTY